MRKVASVSQQVTIMADISFISHALAGGRTLAEVRDAVGHSNVSITSTYLHVVVDDNQELGKPLRVQTLRHC
jgi:site-specific recombinase XerD